LARSPSALLNHLSNMASDEEPDGSFQPPDLHAETGAPDAMADVDEKTPASTQADGDTAPQAMPGEAPAPVAPTSPAPMHVVHPARAPQPSGVVVPGDPTLN
jgi:hypothetical protein